MAKRPEFRLNRFLGSVVALITVMLPAAPTVPLAEERGSVREAVQLEIRRLAWNERPTWDQVAVIAVSESSLVARSGSEIVLLEGEEGTDVASVRRTRSATEIPQNLVSTGDLPTGLICQMLALEMLGIDDEAQVTWFYDGATQVLYTITKAKDAPQKWIVRADRATHPIAEPVYSIDLNDEHTPTVTYWNDTSAILFANGAFNIGYSFPFRYTHECTLTSLWSSLFPDNRPSSTAAASDLKVDCDGTSLTIPTERRRLKGPFVGFDGSLSLLVEDDVDWIWYQIR